MRETAIIKNMIERFQKKKKLNIIKCCKIVEYNNDQTEVIQFNKETTTNDFTENLFENIQ